MVTFSIASFTLLVIRQRDGGVRVFHNTCRHKGAVLVEGSGNAKTLVCPFHAWEYSLEGRLRKAPMIGAIAAFSQNMIVTTLYTNLGEEANCHGILETEVSDDN
mgnify:CR=1 FL=1